MNKEIFRQKSIDKVSSPESLNDYVKVASPSVWLILIGIIILLVGVCIWGITGHLDTKVNASVVSSEGESLCYIAEADISKIKIGQTFNVDNNICTITDINKTPIQGKKVSPFVLHTLDLSDEDWIYIANIKGTLDKGEYGASIVVESVSPMFFIFN